MSELATSVTPKHVPPGLVVDFNYQLDPGGKSTPYEAVEALMKSNPPEIFYTPANGGHWVATSYAAIHEIYRNYDDFTTSATTIPPIKDKPRKLVPIEVDPPEHKQYRAILGPLFTPGAIAKLEDQVREIAIELIEDVRQNGQCEFLSEVAEKFPPLVFLKFMGMPTDRVEEFVGWAKGMLSNDPEVQAPSGAAIGMYIAEFMASKEHNLGDDWASFLFTAKDENNEPALPPDIRLDIAFFLFLAALDTVVNFLTNSWRYLAEKPALVAELREDPDKIPDAIEEMFRVFAVVNSSRMAKKNTTVRGVDILEGEQILLMTAISNRDAEKFEDPLKLDIAREDNVHLSFGAGPHRCIGSNLARSEARIFMDEWLKRIPDFKIASGAKIQSKGGITLGYTSLPLEWEV